LSDYDRAGVAVLPLLAQPFDDPRVSVLLRRLTENIGVKQPIHIFARKYSRRRGGRSSMGTGHCSRTASQSLSRLIRRKIMASSSASMVTSNASPGCASARPAGTVKRRLASIVKIVVGLSHRHMQCQSTDCFALTPTRIVGFVRFSGQSRDDSSLQPLPGHCAKEKLALLKTPVNGCECEGTK
jgi:hypothetical protein